MAGKTLVERVLEWLKREGIEDVVLNLHHRPESITAIVGDGGGLGLRVSTPGNGCCWDPPADRSRHHTWPTLTGPCLIVNGDTLTDLPLAPLIEAHRTSAARATLAVIRNTRPDHYNGIRANADRNVTEFVAKGHTDPTWHFVGIQVVEADVFDRIAPGARRNRLRSLPRHGA